MNGWMYEESSHQNQNMQLINKGVRITERFWITERYLKVLK